MRSEGKIYKRASPPGHCQYIFVPPLPETLTLLLPPPPTSLSLDSQGYMEMGQCISVTSSQVELCFRQDVP